MGWQDDLKQAFEDDIIDHGVRDEIGFEFEVSSYVADQLRPAIVHANATLMCDLFDPGHLILDNLFWVKGRHTAYFLARICFSWNQIRVMSPLGLLGLANLVDSKGQPLYPYFDFHRVKDSWRDQPPLI